MPLPDKYAFAWAMLLWAAIAVGLLLFVGLFLGILATVLIVMILAALAVLSLGAGVANAQSFAHEMPPSAHHGSVK